MENNNVEITDAFVEKYLDKQPPWGFNGMGEIVYLRTYSRPVEGEDRNEIWPETLKRVINGAIEIGVPYTQQEAEDMFDHMFNLRCSFSGRALWQLGTPLVKRFNAASLNNCQVCSVGTKVSASPEMKNRGEAKADTYLMDSHFSLSIRFLIPGINLNIGKTLSAICEIEVNVFSIIAPWK